MREPQKTEAEEGGEMGAVTSVHCFVMPQRGRLRLAFIKAITSPR